MSSRDGAPGLPLPGRFLVLEGVEGVGKTTQAARLAGWLRERGIECVAVREPGGTPVGEAVRSVLLHREGMDVPAETELLLMLAARAALVRDVLRPALERGAWVVADRFELSTFAYQGYGRGLDLHEVRRINTFATGGVRPDLVLVLDLEVEEGRRRQTADGRAPDRIEREGDGFLRRVRDGYRALAAEDPGIRLLSADASVDAVHASIVETVRTRFPGPFPPDQG